MNAGCETFQKWLSDVKGTRPEHWESWFQPIADALVPYVEPLEDDLTGLTAEQEEKETWAGRNKNNKRALLAFAETNPAERLLMHGLLLQSSVRLSDAYLVAASMVWMQQGVAACLSKDTACRFRVLEAHQATLGNQIICDHWRATRVRRHLQHGFKMHGVQKHDHTRLRYWRSWEEASSF